ncbi:MAG TPA: DEAD/DEAH box helicase, partial [Candidatus Acidoferrales bacterium]|nr:DEAD/DEAH box helicase [Candidatus Acidoferrales bacterium]
MAFLKTLFDGNEREVVRLRRTAEQVNALESEIAGLDDAELAAKTVAFKERLSNGATLDELLPEAFAVVREAGKRVLGMRHFDVQIMGGQVLHEGKVAEMKTGEGKTLVATLPVYLNALEGKGVHVVTVNDYLAKRDAEWMGPLYEFLGLRVGIIQHDLENVARRDAYNADITYVTNNEVGFDYLRDNMAWQLEDMVQRRLNFAIVDEVDSILIDEARTPLIISGPSDLSVKWYNEFARIARSLTRDVDYECDEGKRTMSVGETAIERVEDVLGIENLYEAINTPLVGYLNNALKAKELFKRDK